MIQWAKNLVRHHIGEAVLAGVYDGLTAGDGSPPLTVEQAASAARALLGVASPDAPAATVFTAAPPPPLAAPAADGPPALTEPPRRGPGRPRKFQEPPPA